MGGLGGAAGGAGAADMGDLAKKAYQRPSLDDLDIDDEEDDMPDLEQRTISGILLFAASIFYDFKIQNELKIAQFAANFTFVILLSVENDWNIHTLIDYTYIIAI